MGICVGVCLSLEYEHLHTILYKPFLPPANKVCEGYVFTRVCLPMGGVCPIACWDTPPTPPAQCTLGYGQQAGGTHPTGMQSCYVSESVSVLGSVNTPLVLMVTVHGRIHCAVTFHPTSFVRQHYYFN